MYQARLALPTGPLLTGLAGQNVVLDESLLALAENGELPGDVLRLWEAPRPIVVLGRSSPQSEVHWNACREDAVEVVRRASGGAAVVLGPGCLMYALILDRRERPELAGIDRAHHFVLDRMIEALAPLAADVACAGTSDLVIAGDDGGRPRKFSGNSLRMKRSHLLYHGTILYDFPLEKISRWLSTPGRQPKYREERPHEKFVTNFPATREALEASLIAAWNAHEPLPLPTVDLKLPKDSPFLSASRLDSSGLPINDD